MRKSFLCLACLSLVLLSGCQVKETPESAEAAPKALTVFYGESTSDPGLEDVFTERLSQHFPTVILDWESVDWGERFSGNLRMKIAAGEMPDLIIGKAQDVRAFQPTGYLAALGGELYEPILEVGLDQVSVDGEVYGIPYNMLYQGVLYNKNIFYRYGLTVPATPEELGAVVDRLEEMGVTPFGTHFQEVWYTGNVLMQFATNEIFRKNPDWGDHFRKGQASFADSRGWRYCYEQLAYVREHSWPDAMSISQHEADMRFANEECAMYLTGSWSIQTILTIAPQRKLGIFPYPNQDGDAKLLLEPNITFMINAHSNEKELAEQVVTTILEDTELAERVLQFTQTDSMLKGVQADTLRMIRESIGEYEKKDELLDVTLGNRQLVWQFQYNCAEAALKWLKGETTLMEALTYADEHRQESGAAGE